jgi:ribonuclease HI
MGLGPAGEVPTNQRAELTALLHGLASFLPGGSNADIFTALDTTPSTESVPTSSPAPAPPTLVTLTVNSDNDYSVKVVTEWATKWIANNWIKADGNPVKNQDLIMALMNTYRTLTAGGREVKIYHVYAHTGNQWNERVDTLAKAAAAPVPVAAYSSGGQPGGPRPGGWGPPADVDYESLYEQAAD